MQLYVVWAIILLIIAPVLYFVWIKSSDTRSETLQNSKKVSYQEAQTLIQKLHSTNRHIDYMKINFRGGDPVFINYKSDNAECTHLVHKFPNNGPNNIMALVPKSLLQTQAGADIYEVVGNLISANQFNNPVHLIAYDDRPECYRHENFLRYFNHLWDTTAALILDMDGAALPHLSIAGKSGAISSKNWIQVIDDTLTVPSIPAQAAIIAFPIFQRLEGLFLANQINAIAWNPIANNHTQTLPVTAAKIINTMLQMDSQAPLLKNTSFWISDKNTLSRTGFNWIIVLIVIFSWLPIANSIHRSKEPLTIAPTIFSSLYYSIVPLTCLVWLHLISEYWNQPQALFTLPLLCFIIIYFLRKTEKSLLNFRLNHTSNITLWNISLLPLAFLNPIWYILSIPMILLTQKTKGGYFTRFVFCFTPGILPFVLLYLRTIKAMPHIDALSPLYISNYFFPDYPLMIATFFMIGCFITIFLHKKKIHI